MPRRARNTQGKTAPRREVLHHSVTQAAPSLSLMSGGVAVVPFAKRAPVAQPAALKALATVFTGKRIRRLSIRRGKENAMGITRIHCLL